MEKLLLRKYLLCSLAIFFTGCGYKFIHQREKRIYIETISNYTFQPQMEIYLNESLRDTIISHPEFSLVNSEKLADYSLKIKLLKIEREPLFFSRKKVSEIVNARFDIKFDVFLKKEGEVISHRTFSETTSFSLSGTFEEEKVFQKLCKEIALKIYFWLVEENEK